MPKCWLLAREQNQPGYAIYITLSYMNFGDTHGRAGAAAERGSGRAGARRPWRRRHAPLVTHSVRAIECLISCQWGWARKLVTRPRSPDPPPRYRWWNFHPRFVAALVPPPNFGSERAARRRHSHLGSRCTHTAMSNQHWKYGSQTIHQAVRCWLICQRDACLSP